MLTPISAAARTKPVAPAEPAKAAGPAKPAQPAAKAAGPAEPEAAATLAGKLEVRKRSFGWMRPAYDVMVDGARVGTVRRELFGLTPTWRVADAGGKAIAEVTAARNFFGYQAKVVDAQGKPVGTITKDIYRTVVAPSMAINLAGDGGQVLAKSGPVALDHKGRIELTDATGKKIGAYGTTIGAEGAALELEAPLDRRLVLAFVAAQLEAER